MGGDANIRATCSGLKYSSADTRTKPESMITVTSAVSRIIFDTAIEIAERPVVGGVENVIIVSIHGRLNELNGDLASWENVSARGSKSSI